MPSFGGGGCESESDGALEPEVSQSSDTDAANEAGASTPSESLTSSSSSSSASTSASSSSPSASSSSPSSSSSRRKSKTKSRHRPKKFKYNGCLKVPPGDVHPAVINALCQLDDLVTNASLKCTVRQASVQQRTDRRLRVHAPNRIVLRKLEEKNMPPRTEVRIEHRAVTVVSTLWLPVKLLAKVRVLVSNAFISRAEIGCSFRVLSVPLAHCCSDIGLVLCRWFRPNCSLWRNFRTFSMCTFRCPWKH